MSSTLSGDAPLYDFDTTSATTDSETEDAFLKSFGVKEGDEEDAPRRKPKVPSAPVVEKEETEEAADEEAEGDEDSEETPETEEAEGDDEGETEEKAEDKKYVDSDETYVKVKIGDEEKEVSVKDLKRLYGQEASLTRKSQEVATARKEADEGIAKNVAALNVLREKAVAKAKPYADIDWFALTNNPKFTPEEKTQLRDEARAAQADADFYGNELDTLMTTISTKQKADHRVKATECIASLSTPATADKPNPLHIEGWNDKVYDELRAFAKTLGAGDEAINTMVDPIAFKLLHMAMQFKNSSSKVLTVKTKKSPTKIVKSSSSISSSKPTASATDRTKAVANLKRSGSEDDAEAAFLAGMADRD